MAHILVVDDDADMRALVRGALERDGHAVTALACGAQVTPEHCAWAHCILLDVMMPGEDGFATCARIRALAACPILFLTAKTQEADVLTGLGLGGDDYLTKPFASQELLARLRALLRRGGAKQSTVLAVADLRLDPASRRVTRGGREIALSAREFALLEYMMRNAGMPLTRQMIEEHVWNYDYQGGSNVVDVYIRTLRGKLEIQGEKRLIHTVRNVGYVLREEA